jgi:hypothetical protein
MKTKPTALGSSSTVVAMLLAALVTLGGCDSGDENGKQPTPDTGSPEDLGRAVPPDVTEAEVMAAYPGGPYGTVVGAVMENLSWYEPATGLTLELAQWYQHPKVKLLMLVSTAGW